MGYLRRLGGWGSPGESLIGTLCSACALWETDDELVSAAHARFPHFAMSYCAGPMRNERK